MRRPGWFLSTIATGLYVFLYAPIVVIIVYSFNAARFGTVWESFTTKWYGALLQDSAALSATKNTLLLAVISTGIATILGTLLGFGMTRFDFPGRKIFDRLLYVPVFVPDIVFAVSLLLFYSLVRNLIPALELGLTTMILAHVTFQISFVAIVVRARLAGLDPALEEAARDLGAGEWQTFLHVTLPLMLPGVLAGGMLAFTLSLDDFVVSFFTSGPGSTTLPILIYSSVKRGLTPEINALATLIIIISALATVSLTWLQKNGINTTKNENQHPTI
jgi:spermidine/putrescine transport system permease protein